MNTIGTWLYLALIALFLPTCVNAKKQKRQIFREQVLPSLGGKIPEEAFRTDRLALNRLNKEGITVPDGVVLDARHVHKHNHRDQIVPEIIKVYLTPDGRYVPPEGRFHYNHAKTIDTTYVIRAPYSPPSSHKYSNSFESNKHREQPKPQAYMNIRQYTPIVIPTKPGVYKPIVTPLVLPNTDFLQEAYIPTWNIGYDWDTLYEPLDDYFVSNIALYNSHQIINDYQGFLSKFQERFSRHVGSTSTNTNQNIHPQIKKQELASSNANLRGVPYKNGRSNAGNVMSRYTSLTSIPETSFACTGRRGLFADAETNCQVFHNCAGWSKSSSLCPVGTAFSEIKKRCEWWNTVQCK